MQNHGVRGGQAPAGPPVSATGSWGCGGAGGGSAIGSLEAGATCACLRIGKVGRVPGIMKMGRVGCVHELNFSFFFFCLK